MTKKEIEQVETIRALNARINHLQADNQELAALVKEGIGTIIAYQAQVKDLQAQVAKLQENTLDNLEIIKDLQEKEWYQK